MSWNLTIERGTNRFDVVVREMGQSESATVAVFTGADAADRAKGFAEMTRCTPAEGGEYVKFERYNIQNYTPRSLAGVLMQLLGLGVDEALQMADQGGANLPDGDMTHAQAEEVADDDDATVYTAPDGKRFERHTAVEIDKDGNPVQLDGGLTRSNEHGGDQS